MGSVIDSVFVGIAGFTLSGDSAEQYASDARWQVRAWFTDSVTLAGLEQIADDGNIVLHWTR